MENWHVKQNQNKKLHKLSLFSNLTKFSSSFTSAGRFQKMTQLFGLHRKTKNKILLSSQQPSANR